jgi:phosphoglycolate phosphatase
MLFIFDWDGTLVDSAESIVGAMQKAIIELGLAPRADAEVRDIIGLGLPEALRRLYPEVDELESLREAYVRHFLPAETGAAALFAGVADTLEQLKQRGHRLAVATGKSRRGLGRALQRLGWERFFDASRCADETRSKPHPLMLQELLAELAVPVEHAVMVGDTEYDMAMAVSAGMERIAVTYGAHPVARLLPYRPALVVDDFQQLLGWCGRRGAAAPEPATPAGTI